jgi:hypothetical protein
MEVKNTPIWQLKQNAESYRRASIAFHEDSIRYLKKAEESAATAEEYEKAIQILEASYVNH